MIRYVSNGWHWWSQPAVYVDILVCQINFRTLLKEYTVNAFYIAVLDNKISRTSCLGDEFTLKRVPVNINIICFRVEG